MASSTARGCSPNSADTAARSSWSGTHRSSQTTVPASARRSEISATGKPSASRTPLRYTGSVPYTTAYPSRHPPRAHCEQGQMSAPAAQFEGELEQPCLPFLIRSRIWWLPRLGVATGSCADVLQRVAPPAGQPRRLSRRTGIAVRLRWEWRNQADNSGIWPIGRCDMVRRRPLPSQRLRHPLRQRAQRLTSRRAVREALVSLAGLLGGRVDNQAGEEVGRLADLVARWADPPGPASSPEASVESYPPVTGLVVQVGHRQVFVAADQVAELGRQGVRLSSARLDLREVERREGEVLLARDVLDHQLVDTDGMKVIRAADLYLAQVAGRWRLVGVDVSMQTLARRLGPARWRWVPTPERVIAWAAIQPFGIDPGQVRLRGSARRLRPGELADLLEDLGRPERQELLESLEPEVAADALEEMDPGELDALLHEIPPEQTATLLARMEPDEAVDALRELDTAERQELLARLPDQDTVAQVNQRLREIAAEQPDLDLVAVVDDQGRLVDVIGMVELLAAEPQRHLGELIGPPWPVTVGPTATIGEVAEALVENRRTSVLVTDEDGRPLGRIGADDVVDALLPERGRLHFPRLLQ